MITIFWAHFWQQCNVDITLTESYIVEVPNLYIFKIVLVLIRITPLTRFEIFFPYLWNSSDIIDRTLKILYAT